MGASDDTQSRISTREMQRVSQAADYESDGAIDAGPGCLIWSLIGVLVVIFAVVIVVVAAFAGWSSGQTQAQTNATMTQAIRNQEQCTRLAGEVTAGNAVLLQARMDFLLTQTPPVSCVLTVVPTATALYLTSQPTVTPTATAAPPTATATLTPTATSAPEVTPEATAAASGYDLDALMEEAQASMNLREWSEAIDTLDAISAIDPTYRPAAVERMLFEALTTRARQLYRSGEQLAEAIVLTNRAEDLGDIGDLNFERLVASLWLDAQRNINVNYLEAIRLLTRVTELSPNYREGEAARLLYRQRVAYGDALAAGGDYCAAADQYDLALSQNSADGEVRTKRDDARTACTEGTPAEGTPGEASATSTPGVAPVGQPGD